MKASIRWCSLCNVPLLGVKCDVCGDKGFSLKTRGRADLRPVFGEERRLILETLDKQYGSGTGKKILYEDHLVLANKLFYVDQAYEIISDGRLIGYFFFDVYIYDWVFKPMEYGCLRIFKNLGIGVFKEDVKKGEDLKIARLNLPPEARYLPIHGEKGVYGVAQLMGSGEARVIKTFQPILAEKEAKSSGLEDVLKSNMEYLRRKESRAVAFVHRISNRIRKPVCVSYSGGKDSLATLLVVLKAGVKPKISFTNTGIELPETLENVEKVADSLGLELLTGEAYDGFWKGLDIFGLPSRDYRWCCKVTKLIPTARLYAREFPGGSLTFVGQRALESVKRARTGSVWLNQWIPGSICASPINDWDMLTVWLYLLYRGVFNLVNKAYFYGFDRIGCYPCPSCSIGDYLLLEKIHPDLWGEFRRKLKHLSDEGSPSLKYHLWRWKRVPVKMKKVVGDVHSRRLEKYVVREDGAATCLVLDRQIDEDRLRELVKTLEEPATSYVLNGNRVVFRLENRNGSRKMISIVLRATYCIGCGSCEVWCPQQALFLDRDGKIRVDETRCKKCLTCMEKCPVVEFLSIS
ncbi:MAG: phosphoadenosine phosphosulfate reductase family protein [Crenarchaeota archaeon]|nr:phosphoadenosine phosphosulfate reductase family protein [Thermoproteota archaeon]